jgi:ATP diphosphatase
VWRRPCPRAARTGFDWPDTVGVRAKIDEELQEVERASSQEEKEEEIGDLLFAVVNLARHLRVDAEQALRSANVKFERRFRIMEDIGGSAFANLSLDEKEALWQQAKRR